MTVSHLTRSRNQLWSDLVGELGGSGSNLTLSEEELIAMAANTYGGSISAKTSSRAELIAALVNGAGGSVSAKTHSETEMMAALANALGGSVSALTGSFNSNLAASVNAAASEGGGGAPGWVPDAFAEGIYIDLVGGDPQGRAWVFGTGEVAVDTQLGSDANASNYWGDTEYDPEGLTADGYVNGGLPPAFIGAARTAIFSDATVTLKTKGGGSSYFMLMAADGNDAVEVDIESGELTAYSSNGSFSTQIFDAYNSGASAINNLAITVSATRFDIALSGADAVAGVLDGSDRPPGNPLVAALFDTSDPIQAIGIKTTPLPTTAGLSELSETGVTNTVPTDLIAGSWTNVSENTGTTATTNEGSWSSAAPESPQTIAGDFSFTDAEGNPIAVLSLVDDEGGTFDLDLNDGIIENVEVVVIEPLSVGPHSFTLRASDHGGLYVEQEFTITVTA